MAQDANTPIFEIEDLNWSPTPQQGHLVSADVGNNILVLGTSNGFLIRWSIETTILQEFTVAKKSDEKIHKVFIDPMGLHVLVSLTNGTLYYLGDKKDRLIPLTKAKGFIVESAAWYSYPHEPKVQRVLLGTTKGTFYEISIEDNKEKNVKRVFELINDIGTVLDHPIVGIRVCQLPSTGLTSTQSGSSSNASSGSASLDSSGQLYFVMAATPRRCYHFVGGPSIEELFVRYDARQTHLNFQELPGTPSSSELRFYVSPSAIGSSSPDISPCPSRFAWLTGAGVCTGQFSFAESAVRSSAANEMSSGTGEQIVQYGELQDIPVYYDADADPSASTTSSALQAYGLDDDRRSKLSPLSIALTEFHTVLMFKNRIVAINRLNKEVVFHRLLPKEAGTLRHMCVSERNQTLFAFSDRHIYEIEISAESRDAWSIYLSQHEFELAKRYCQNARQRERVIEAQADYAFDRGLYEEAAILYADTNRSFEEVALKLVSARSPALLLGSVAGSTVSRGNPYYGSEPPSLQSIAAATATPLSLLALAGGRAGATSSQKVNNSIDVEDEAIHSVLGGARSALKIYLTKRLSQIPRELSTQMTLLCTWLAEVHLDCITTLSDSLRKLSLRRRPTTSPIATALMAAAAAAAAAAETGSDTSKFSGAIEDGFNENLSSLITLDSSASSTNQSENDVRRKRLRQKATKALGDEVDEFKLFLTRYASHLPTRVTLELIAAQGRTEELLFFAGLKNDIDFVIRHHIVREDFAAAVKTLAVIDLQAQPNFAELFYIHAPDLICARPKETVDVLIAQPALNPVELLPAIVRCTAIAHPPPGIPLARKSGTEVNSTQSGSSKTSKPKSGVRTGAWASPSECEVNAIRFLRDAVHKGHTDTRLHNMLIALLARQPKEDALLKFLKDTASKPMFDKNYALRVCRQEGTGRRRACVALYRMQGMYLEAVELALEESDSALARSVLLEAQGHLTQTPETLKQLWLRFVKKVVENGDVAAALAVLRDDAACILRLEDILHCLPDFVQIKAFKSEILRSLQGFQATITNLKAEMEKLTESANRIRDTIHDLQSRHCVVRQSQRCDACSQPVIMRQFLAFPCSHVFHADCCYTIAQYYLASNAVRKQSAFRRIVDDSDDPALRSLEVRGSLSAEQESLLVEAFSQSQCPLCSEVMVDSVQEPFVSVTETGEIESWSI